MQTPEYLTMTPEQAASDRATVQGYDTPHRHGAWAIVERWMAEHDAQQGRNVDLGRDDV